MSSLSRRRFVQAAGISAAALTCRGNAFGSLRSPDRSFEHGQALRQFRYDQIQLQPGLQQAQLDQTHSVLMGLNDDSLLMPYRLRTGLPASGCELGGWYNTADLGAETFGQWVSALSRYYATTQETDTRLKVDRLVRGFSSTVEAAGKIYGDNKITKGVAYHYDKLVCGLMDAHEFCHQPDALNVLNRLNEVSAPLLPGKAMDELQEGHGFHESYTIPENQLIAWQRGASDLHLETARAYLYHSFFDPLARGENVLPGRHAYSHVDALCSAAKAYLVLGDEKYLRAAINGFSFVAAQSFATGGGPNETFLPQPANSSGLGFPAIRTLGDSLAPTHWHFETPCGSYAHFKLTRYLLRITKDSTYGDSMERVMFNTVLGAKPLQPDGRAFYQSDYNPDGHKFYFEGYRGVVRSEWPCCSGTLSQIAADYRISAYFHSPDGVYVNLYIQSAITWQQGAARVSLTQSGSYPVGDEISLAVNASESTTFELYLRIPTWARKPSIRVNGKLSTEPVEPGTFACLKRRWHSGDRIDLELLRELELKAVDAEHPDTVALVYGPLVLFAVTEGVPKVTRRQLLAARRPNAEMPEWRVYAIGGSLRLIPFWAVKDERYSLYQTVTG
jgi:hypothetical protein